MQRFVILIIGAVIVGGIIGGAFVGGITIGKDQGREEITQEMQDRTSQFALRFSQSDEEDQESDFIPPTGAFMGRGGTMGTVEKIEGNIIIVKTISGSSINVATGSDTIFQKTDTGTLNDIEIGVTITISGETQEDGTIEANTIYINPGIGTSP